MSFNKDQFRQMISLVLDFLELNSLSAIELLMLTAAQESHLGHYLYQIKGPAVGIFQMEPRTEDDIWDRFLSHPKQIRLNIKIKSLLPIENTIPDISFLQSNINYQISMCRIFYYRIPEKLPLYNNILELAKYYKKYYNTIKGAATIDEIISNYNRYVNLY